MSRTIGIDLGTTNSCVAVLDDKGVPRVLYVDGERTIPSVVSFSPSGHIEVGLAARRQSVTNAAATIHGAKRLIGRKVNAEDVAWFARLAPFRIVAAPNGDAWVRVHGESVSPQEVSAQILRRLRSVAETSLGEPVTRAVVTVPAYFDDAQRQATRDAGAIAGLDVLRILNEPTAAALAFGAHRVDRGQRMIAVFDLGGGTFDISIMSVENNIFEVMATDGDSALGGDDWDRRVLEHLVNEVSARYGLDLTADATAISRMREACEEAKKALSTEKTAHIRLPFLATDKNDQPINYERSIGRADVERLTADLIARLEAPCQRALAAAGLTASGIHDVLLVGGMTRWPQVEAVVERFFGKRPSKGANPDEVVALGAATYAGILAGDSDEAALLDVTPRDIGIKVGEGKFSVLIPRNSMLPVRTRRLFATSAPDQKFVSIELYQGESYDVAKNRKLGQVVLGDLPPGPAGSVRVELTLTVDVESILSVTARELKSGKVASVVIRPSGGLSQREIYEIIARRRQASAQASGLDFDAGGVNRVPTIEMEASSPELELPAADVGEPSGQGHGHGHGHGSSGGPLR